MISVKVDTSGKIYLPKKVMEKIATGEYVIIPMPDGDIVLRRVKKYTIKEAQSMFKVTKSLRKVREEIAEEAAKGL